MPTLQARLRRGCGSTMWIEVTNPGRPLSNLNWRGDDPIHFWLGDAAVVGLDTFGKPLLYVLFPLLLSLPAEDDAPAAVEQS